MAYFYTACMCSACYYSEYWWEILTGFEFYIVNALTLAAHSYTLLLHW